MIPDNPEEGVLHLTKSSLNAINKYSWDRSQALKALALLDGMKLLASSWQESYPYSYQVTRSTEGLTALTLTFRERAVMTGCMDTVRL